MITDFHSHILPGVDDGSQSVEESLTILRRMAEQGISRVLATPHFYPWCDTPEQFLEKRNRAAKQLERAMADQPGLPEIGLGAEVYYYRGISESEFSGELTICGGRGMLVELPEAHWGEEVYRDLAGLWEKQGIIPIIAHIDRYITPLRFRKILRRLEDLPVMIQANASFFCSRRTGALAMELLRTDRIHLIGSDCHNTTDRGPNLDQAVEIIRRKLGDEALDRIRCNEREILGD